MFSEPILKSMSYWWNKKKEGEDLYLRMAGGKFTVKVRGPSGFGFLCEDRDGVKYLLAMTSNEVIWEKVSSVDFER